MSARRGVVAVMAALAITTACAAPAADGVRVTRVQERSAHTRVGPASSSVHLGAARLIVPPGVAPADTVIGFGTGGVADADGALAGSGVVLTASRALHGPLVVLLTPDFTDRALIAGRTPALLDVARGRLLPCLPEGERIACAAPAPGAYVVRGTEGSADPAARPLLEVALAGELQGRDGGRPWWSAAAGMLAALCAGAAVVLALRREGIPTGRPEADTDINSAAGGDTSDRIDRPN